MSETTETKSRRIPIQVVVVAVVIALLAAGWLYAGHLNERQIASVTYSEGSVITDVSGTAEEPLIAFETPADGSLSHLNVIQPSGEYWASIDIHTGQRSVDLVLGGGLWGPPEEGVWTVVAVGRNGESLGQADIEITASNEPIEVPL